MYTGLPGSIIAAGCFTAGTPQDPPVFISRFNCESVERLNAGIYRVTLADQENADVTTRSVVCSVKITGLLQKRLVSEQETGSDSQIDFMQYDPTEAEPIGVDGGKIEFVVVRCSPHAT